MKHSLRSLINDLENLGIEKGDVLYIKANLGEVGEVEGNIKETILNAFFQAVGESGTVFTTAYTKSFFLPKINKDYIFDRNTIPTTGALSKLFLKYPTSVRSKHPTNSFVAIGKYANEILNGHDENALSYSPIGTGLQFNPKEIIIGCVDEPPDTMTGHYVQQELGLTSKNIFRNKIGVYYYDNKLQKKLFKRRDMGGCSNGFYKFYAHYIMQKKLKVGKFGDAYTIAINAKDSYKIQYEILKKNPRYGLCNDKNCFSCRGTRLYNKRDMPFFYLRNFLVVKNKILKRQVKN